jgi:hypothetical protein
MIIKNPALSEQFQNDNQKSRPVGTIPKWSRKIVERGKMYAPEKHTHEAHIPDLVQALQLNVAGEI